MIRQTAFVSCIGLALSAFIFAQSAGKPGAGGGATGGAPGTIPSPTRPTNTNPNTTQPSIGNQPNLGDIQRPIYISGKVMLDDGTPPSEPVTIQMICGGSPRNVGYTDSKGRFSIDLGNRNNTAMFSDASQTNDGRNDPMNSRVGMGNNTLGGLGGERSFMGCDVRAALPGFRSDQVSLTNRRSLDNPEVGTVVLHRMGNVEGLTISATSAMAPKDAKKALDKGRNEAKKGKWDSAEREFQKAVDVYPKYAAAWYELGVAQQQQNNIEAARKSYAQALAADAKFVSPYQQLALIALKENQWDDVAADTDRLLRLNPVDFPQAWFYNALANYKLQKFDAAEKAARQGLQTDTAHHIPKLDHLLGVLLAGKHDYPGAAEHLKNYLKLAPQSPDAEMVKKQIADVEKEISPQAVNKQP